MSRLKTFVFYGIGNVSINKWGYLNSSGVLESIHSVIIIHNGYVEGLIVSGFSFFKADKVIVMTWDHIRFKVFED